MRRKWEKGSLTVEAVFVVGIFLWMIFLILALLFFVHERAFYTACGCEMAQKESSREVWQKQESDTVKEEARELAQERRVPVESPQMDWKRDRKEIEVTYSGKVIPAVGRTAWVYESRGVSRIIRPTEEIRKLRLLQRVLPE